MDLRNSQWFSQLQVSGVGELKSHHGSVMHLMAETLKDLQQLTPRELADGKKIVLILSSKPVKLGKDSTVEFERTLEVTAGLDDSQLVSGPEPGETADGYVARLLAIGMPLNSASMLANEWFGGSNQDVTHLTDWMNDVKAARFRLLNASREAYESASPSEYLDLKSYVLARFPSFCKNITFRIA